MATKINQKKTIIPPIAEELYASFMKDNTKARELLDILYEVKINSLLIQIIINQTYEFQTEVN